MPIRLSSIRFAPTFLPTLAAICALCLTLYFGHWQQGRAGDKRVLQAEFEIRAGQPPIVLGAGIGDPIALRYARATARGEWVASEQIFLDNKFDDATVGFHVITPLKIEGTNRYVLVNRGWVARSAGSPTPPAIPVPAGGVAVAGVLTLPSSRFLELAESTIQGNVWQNLTVERYRQLRGHDVLPLVLLAATAETPLKPVSERPDARAEKHVEYMLTWYSLAATVVVLWVALNVKLERGLPQSRNASEGNEG